jgi:polysaccharide export outer membrane protein
MPRELDKVSQPPYIIETPDILEIDALRTVPKPPYRIQPLDVILVQASNVVPTEPIAGPIGVDPDGTINLGPSYGSVQLAGMTLAEARAAVEKQLRDAGFKNTDVRVALYQSRALQQIRGEHIVRPDGTISLGTYGSVYVSGLTIDLAKTAIEGQLSRYLLNPEVTVDVSSYNSKAYYIVTDGGGYGEQIYRFPSTGNETVLDALSQINGLPFVASKNRIWVARPSPAGTGCYQVLPVDYLAMTRGGATETNYQIFPGDRVFVEADPLIRADSFLARVFTPLERVFGVTLLGSAVTHSLGAPIGLNGGTAGGASGAAGLGTGF